jgi:Tfp pilus assembly protein PilF
VSAKKKYKNQPARKTQGPVAPRQHAASIEKPLPDQINIILPIAIAVITFICYSYTLQNQFLNWDDWIYVTKDPNITSFSTEHLKQMMFHNITLNYFHPLTMLSLAVNYHFSKLAPEGYYFTNILIHCCNTILVYFFVKVLLESMSEKLNYGHIKNIPWIAGVCAILHGLHPMHVESVSWISERKDIFYSFFYLGGLIMYVRYLNSGKIKDMIWVVVIFVCSLLSKPLAVSFPFSLFAVDFLFKRKLSVGKIILEKWPFFLIALAAGILTLFTVKDSGSMALLNGFTLLHKLTIPFYAFLIYSVKVFAPYHLCSYYPYPPVTSDGWLPTLFYICPVIDAVIVGIPIYFAWKAGENYFRIVVFGIGFFLSNVVFILQFLSAGVAVVCERYTYMGYVGILFLIGYFVFNIIDRKPAYRIPILTATAVLVLAFGYLCNARTKAWHNSETLWHDVIVKYPRQWMVPYMNLADYYVDSNKMDSAFANYNILVQLHSESPGVYRNLGNMYAMRKDYKRSLELYEQAVKFDSGKSADVFLDRAVTYSIMGNLDLALQDYDRAYKLDSTSEKLLANRAYAYMSLGKFDLSIADYNHVIRINPNDYTYYFRRGQAESNKGDINNAITDYLKSLTMQPTNPECMYDLSLAYNALKDYNNALNYAMKAKQGGFQVPDTYFSGLQKSAGITK